MLNLTKILLMDSRDLIVFGNTGRFHTSN